MGGCCSDPIPPTPPPVREPPFPMPADFEEFRNGCEDGSTYTVSRLISRGLNPSDRQCADRNGYTPLHLALYNGRVDVASLLLREGIDINQPARDQSTPLMSACKNGGLNVVKLLLHRKADVNAKDSSGWTALAHACKKGNTSVVKALISAGSDTNWSVRGQVSLAKLAESEGNYDCAELVHDGLKARAEKGLHFKRGSTYHDRLIRFNQYYDPSSLKLVDASLAQWEGKEEALFKRLTRKYGPEPSESMLEQQETRSAAARSSWNDNSFDEKRGKGKRRGEDKI